MATLLQIASQPETILGDLEREMVRQIIGISGKSGSAIREESNVRMDALSSAQNQIVRALLQDYDEISFDTTRVRGGGDGLDFDPTRDKQAIADELRRMLYPSEIHDPNTPPIPPDGIRFYTDVRTNRRLRPEYD